MGSTEFRIATIEEFLTDAISAQEASERLDLHRVSFWRLVKRYETQGRQGVEHGLKGKPSNRSRPEAFKQKVREAFQKDYASAGRSVHHFYQEKKKSMLRKVSYGTVLSWLKENRPLEDAELPIQGNLRGEGPSSETF